MTDEQQTTEPSGNSGELPTVEYIELNMSNFSYDDVAQLNQWAIWAAGELERIERLQAQADIRETDTHRCARCGRYRGGP